jgi:nitrogen fixation/metabolism regulation signal transduction histidine kinase
VKLRGRFTLTLALAALVPISVAAIVTRQVVAASYRQDYEDTRASVAQAIERELTRQAGQVAEAVGSLASHDHPFVGGLLRELVKGGGHLDPLTLRRLREQGGPVMRGLALDVLTITDGSDHVLISPHLRADNDTRKADVRQRALATNGAPYFARDQVMTGPTFETVLVAQAAQLSRDEGLEVAVWAGRKVGDEVLAAVRRPGRVDARLVAASGELLLPPRGADWAQLAVDPPIREPLRGPDGQAVAYVEVAVSDGDLGVVLRNLTLTSAILAALALGAVVIIGLLVARRMTTDLDKLVEGSLAVARGDLDHRVPVRARDEVGAVAAAFNFMMEDLRTAKERLVIAERIAAWQEIARRLAHEIKNPLTPIQMAMDTLRKTWRKQHPSFGEILEESTTTVLEEADRLKRIVAEFSDFARMPKPELGRVELDEVVGGALALYHGDARIEVRLAGGDKPLAIEGDRGQITQVVLNLIENARDAIAQRVEPATGKVQVTTRLGEAGDRTLFTVEDNGPGVPTELKDKIFAPYFTTKHAKGGTGLGLAIVHRIVSDHGGRITITDAPGGGARFTVELPLRSGASLLASRI